MKLQYCLTIILCLYLKGDSQIKPLTIGDKVPDIEIKNIFNYPALRSNLSAFSNKVLILDFMATNCSSCLKALPRFDSLQKTYRDKIQIVLVTSQSSEKVRSFLKTHTIEFPFVAEDSLLNNFFPHAFISHEVWIKDGVVKAITHAGYVTGKNVETLLSGKQISWPVKRDMATFDYSRSLFQVSNNIYYNAFASCLPDVIPKYTRDSNAIQIRESVINYCVIDLYLRSYNIIALPASHILLNVKDTLKFIYDKTKITREEWKKKNTFCYELVLPPSVNPNMRGEKMRSDLDLYFGLKGSIEKRNVECYVVRKINSPETVTAHNRKISLSALLFLLNERSPGKPFIDETGTAGKLLLSIDENAFSDFSILKKSGLDIITQNRETDMLVLTEKNY